MNACEITRSLRQVSAGLRGFVFFVALAQVTGATELIVKGTANPWLAGMPNGSQSDGDFAPQQSPVPVVTIPVTPGNDLQFTVAGSIGFAPDRSGTPPDGSAVAAHRSGAVNGISGYTGPQEALVGVFLGPTQPSLFSPPAAADFSTSASRDFTNLSPLLQQVFFIGDGRNGSGVVQRFRVPAGATRLYLGGTDGFNWANNVGQFTVSVSRVSSSQPEGISVQLVPRIVVRGNVGASYRIEFSTDMTQWTQLASVVLGASPEFFYEPPELFPKRFYRLVRISP